MSRYTQFVVALATAVTLLACGESDGGVSPTPQEPTTSVTVNLQSPPSSSTQVMAGGTLTLSVSVNPSTASQVVNWKSDDEDVATVSGSVVSTHAPGTAVMTGTPVADPTKKVFVTVNVMQPPPPVPTISVDLTRNRLSILPSRSIGFAPLVTANASITWSSSNENVASVDDEGVVTAHAFGVDTIFASVSPTAKVMLRIWVGRPVLSFAASVAGCPTQEEINFVTSAVPVNFDGDTTTVACTQSPGTVLMSFARAMTYKVVVASAGLDVGSAIRWAPDRNLFDWMLFSPCRNGGIHMTALDHDGGQASNCTMEISPFGAQRIPMTLLTGLGHLARHLDGKFHSCGPLGGTYDRTIAEMGAWAVNYELAVQFSGNSAFTAQEKAFASEQAQILRSVYFCDEPK